MSANQAVEWSADAVFPPIEGREQRSRARARAVGRQSGQGRQCALGKQGALDKQGALGKHGAWDEQSAAAAPAPPGPAAMDVETGEVRASWGTLPNLVSFLRIPMGLTVWFHAHEFKYVVGLVVLAAISDGLDGWLARLERSRLSMQKAKVQSELGAWLDPFCDKAFIVLTASAMAWAHEAPMLLMGLVLSREILLLPCLIGYRLMPEAWRRSHSLTARWPGKLTTITQFIACGLAMTSSPALATAAWASAIFGLYAVAHYVTTALRQQ